jgi:hypothetical protein
VALRVLWGRSKAKAIGDVTASVPALPGMPGMVPMPPGMGLAPPPGGPAGFSGGMMLPPGLGLAPPPGIGMICAFSLSGAGELHLFTQVVV